MESHIPFVYLVLYCWPITGRVSILDVLPFDTEKLTHFAELPWHALCPWVASSLFRLSGPMISYHPTGSGDTTLDYIQVFCFAVIALFAAAVWSILDRRRRDYRILYASVRLLVRSTLSLALLSYGFAKVYPMQFSPPLLSTLTENFGDASPMGLLWTFMGASTAYTVFSGFAEAIAGLLLLFRRTAALGALVASCVLLNVVMLNFCYDVPVKLYSSHLLLMSLFFLLPDASALWSFFILHRSAQMQGLWRPKFQRASLRRAAVALQILVIAAILYNNVWLNYGNYRDFSRVDTRPALYGVWDADSTENLPWRRVVIDSPQRLVVNTPAGEKLRFRTSYEDPKHVVKLTGWYTNVQGDFTYEKPDEQHLVLRGNLEHVPVVFSFHRFSANQLLLTSRGFHWISEDPFNR